MLPWNWTIPKGNESSSNHPFSGANWLLVSGRVHPWKLTARIWNTGVRKWISCWEGLLAGANCECVGSVFYIKRRKLTTAVTDQVIIPGSPSQFSESCLDIYIYISLFSKHQSNRLMASVLFFCVCLFCDVGWGLTHCNFSRSDNAQYLLRWATKKTLLLSIILDG